MCDKARVQGGRACGIDILEEGERDMDRDVSMVVGSDKFDTYFECIIHRIC